jgi:hypothetical protein
MARLRRGGRVPAGQRCPHALRVPGDQPFRSSWPRTSRRDCLPAPQELNVFAIAQVNRQVLCRFGPAEDPPESGVRDRVNPATLGSRRFRTAPANGRMAKPADSPTRREKRPVPQPLLMSLSLRNSWLLPGFGNMTEYSGRGREGRGGIGKQGCVLLSLASKPWPRRRARLFLRAVHSAGGFTCRETPQGYWIRGDWA